MADTVTSRVVNNSKGKYTVHITGISDGTGESNVVKIDKSTLLTVAGAEPAALSIGTIRWNVQGFSYVKLHFDHTTDDTAMLLSGNGYDDFTPGGGLRDPLSAGQTGDLMLTSVGAAAGATYDITITCIL